MPGSSGGPNWQGAAFDPDTGMLYIPSISSFVIVELIEPDASRSDLRYVGKRTNKIEASGGLPILKTALRPYFRHRFEQRRTGLASCPR